MNKLIASAFFVLVSFYSFSQIEPTQNYEEVVGKDKVKSIKMMYFTNEDTSTTVGCLYFKKEFNQKGQISQKYMFTFWDVVSYDYTTSYKYDSLDRLIEEESIQKILDLDENDHKFIEELGATPSNTKVTYAYDSTNHLIKEQHYSFGKDGFTEKIKPDNVLTYSYKNGLLIEEKSIRLSYGYIKNYTYDSKNRLIEEATNFDNKSMKKHQTSYVYDKHDHLIEKKYEDLHMVKNNTHIKYEYNREGKKLKLFTYSTTQKKWLIVKNFNYNEQGFEIFDDEETSFTYNSNGLIESELWKSTSGKQVVYFVTTYEFQ